MADAPRPAEHHAALVANDHLDPATSLLFAEGSALALLWLGVAAGLRAAGYLRSARRERAELGRATELRSGLAVLVGTVDHEEGAQLAVRVEVDQEGTEQESSGSWSHRWEETGRRVKVRPFGLRLDDGRRVRVLPSKNVAFVDALDKKILVNRTKRTLVAELVPGERVWIRGEVELAARSGGAYRGDGQATLRPPPGSQMLISSEPLGERLERRARFHGRSAACLLVALAALEVALSGFHRRVHGGRAETYRITALEHEVTKGEDGDIHQYLLTLAPGPGATPRPLLGATVDEDDFPRLQVGDTVPVRRAPDGMGRQDDALGRGATLHGGFLVLLLGLPLAALLMYVAARSATRPWYRRSLTHGDSGKLPDVVSPGEAPHDDS